MTRRNQPTIESYLAQWRRTAGAVAQTLLSTDGRWALVSTSVTALVAGSVAWLAATTMPPGSSQSFIAGRTHSLIPYELYLRLAGQDGGVKYAALGPGNDFSAARNAVGATHPSVDADNALTAEQINDDNDNAGIDTHTITLDPGDTLKGALTDAGVSDGDANATVVALDKVYDVRQLRAGQTLTLSFAPTPASRPAQQEVTVITPTSSSTVVMPASDAGLSDDDDDSDNSSVVPAAPTPAGKLLSVTFSPTIDHDITIARATDGGFVAQDQKKDLKVQYHRAGATIDSSLYLAAMQAGIPADVVVEMIHMFSYKVDFQRDMQPGDAFEVMYSYYYTPDGRPAKDGNIVYASMKLANRTVTLYRYQPDPNQPADYFDANGESAKGLLMKTPVDGARITSGFGMRFHPVLGYTRMHKGIDFGVPVGTPVMAAGSGVVAEAGRKGGYGNFLLINHGNGYSTANGHLSRYAPGIHDGTHVRQGQVVAYSGNTGLTTGPHLHYEIRVNNVQVNPLKVKVATGRKLAGSDLRSFLVERLHIDSELASMPLETKLADAAGDLRAAKP